VAEDLAVADVEAYTGGRMLASDAETQRALDAALARVRRFCGWHVSPARTETLTVDCPWSSLLILPTMKIRSITSITVDGNAVDLTTVRTSADAPGCLETVNFQPWGGYRTDSGFGRVAVALSHGFSAAEAADFRQAVLELIDSTSLQKGTGGSGPLVEKKVDDVTYRWSGVVDRFPGSIAKNPLNESLLYQFRLLPFA
jgi:hypothetical protein